MTYIVSKYYAKLFKNNKWVDFLILNSLLYTIHHFHIDQKKPCLSPPKFA